MKFYMIFRRTECEVTANGYEYSPEINFDGHDEIYATRLDNGEPFEMTEEEELAARDTAARMEWEDVEDLP